MNFAKARHNMVASQVRTWDVLNPDILNAMEQLPREDFVPETFREFAYADMAIPLGHGQSMLPPKEQGRILQALAIQKHDRVLEICTGTGYLTALAAQFAKEVVSIDIHASIQAMARENLAKHAIQNVKLVTGSVSCGEIEQGLFDVIMITGGLPSLPLAYQKMLNPGGRIFAIMGQAPAMQATLWHHPGEDVWQKTVLYETIVPMMEQAFNKEFNF